MPEPEQDPRPNGSAAPVARSNPPKPPGVKFNSVGREEPARTILTPRADPALRRRTFVALVFVVIAVLLLILVVASPFGVERSDPNRGRGGSFDVPRGGETGL